MSYSIHFDAQDHRYSVGGIVKPSVTQVLAAAGLLNLDGIPADILRRAADRGTKVHRAGALLLRGRLDWLSVAPEIGGYVRALDAFLRHSEFVPIPERVEEPVYCPRYDYCGTPDVIGLHSFSKGKRSPVSVLAVNDWKTGMMCAVEIQLAAYARMLGIRHRVAIKLNSDGTYNMRWFPPETLRHDFDRFLLALDQTRREGRWAA